MNNVWLKGWQIINIGEGFYINVLIDYVVGMSKDQKEEMAFRKLKDRIKEWE
jgi:hypothetical protein